MPTAIVHSANSNSCILFVCQLQLHNKGNYPVMYDGKDRWLGAIIGIKNTKATSIITIDAAYNEDVEIAEKHKLLNYTAWSEKNK